MHRSGTSLLANLLGRLNMSYGGALIEPHLDNPGGYWEHAEVVSIHDHFLKVNGRSWDDPKPFESDAFRSMSAQFSRDRLRTVFERDFAPQPLWVVKDPRHPRLLPLWDEIFDDKKCDFAFLHIIRDPCSVARSLAVRNGFPLNLSLVLWMRHNLEAEQYTRGRKRSFIEFETLQQHPARVIRHCLRRLGVSHRLEVEPSEKLLRPHVKKEFVHHTTSEQAGVARELFPWVRRTHHTLQRLVRNDDTGGRNELDRIGDEVEAAERLLVLPPRAVANQAEVGLRETLATELQSLQRKQSELIEAIRGGLDGLFVQARDGVRRDYELKEALADARRDDEAMRRLAEGFRDLGERVAALGERFHEGLARVPEALKTAGSASDTLLSKSLDLLEEFDAHLKELRIGQQELRERNEETRIRESELRQRHEDALRNVVRLEQELEALASEVTRRQGFIEEQRENLERAQAKASELEGLCRSISQSLSWRITRPLRFLRARLTGSR
jgi:hypothetical protein